MENSGVQNSSSRPRFFQRRVVAPLAAFLKQGTTPEKLALCVAIGMVIGVFPVLGLTTLLCALVALVLRLNQPAIQLVNYLMYPVQLALIIPLLKAGDSMFSGRGASILSASMLATAVRNNPVQAIASFWNSTLFAILLWVILAPFIAAPAYLIALSVFRRWRASFR